MAVGVVIGAVAGGLWVLPAALITAVVVLYFARSARRRLGGMTGDVLGACEQVIEISLLTLALVVVRLEAPIWAGFL
jgi:adenosylcobinamide-GDP ribazoletransferase